MSTIGPVFARLAALVFLCWLCFHGGAAQAQTVSRYTNTTDSAAGAITGAQSCTVGVTFQRDIFVADDFSVQDVNFGALIAHSTRSELGLFLRSPSGTIVMLTSANGGTADNLNILFDDQAGSNVSTHTANDTAAAGTVVPTYQRTFRPTNALNGTFFGQSSYGTWSLFVCDFNNNGVNGTFFQADLFLTRPAASADLSIAKTVASGSATTAVYTLSVTNSASSALTATGVTVRDILPAGVTFASASGTGTYNSGTGIWTLGTNIAPGQTVTIDINVNITATIGTTITNVAQVWTSGTADPDSTPGNSVTTEDDYAARSFTVGGRIPGIPPSINSICSLAGSTTNVLDWNNHSWTSGSTTGSANLVGIGTVAFAVATQGTFSAPLALTVDNNGGFGSAGLSLFQSIEYTNINQVTTTTVTLPVAVPGAQFRVFDVDYAVNDFADKLTVTGTLAGGAPINATLTNNSANYISGNSAIGDAGAAGTTDDGNVVVTFSQPIDTITIVYGNHTTAPADPDGQAISIHDFTFCNPRANLTVSKISTVVDDYISGANDKYLPGALVRYCITINNAGSAAATNVSASDTVPSDVTFVPGSMASGTSCGTATTPEDDDASDAGEVDAVRMNFNGTVVAGTAATLAANASIAMVFNAIVD